MSDRSRTQPVVITVPQLERDSKRCRDKHESLLELKQDISDYIDTLLHGAGQCINEAQSSTNVTDRTVNIQRRNVKLINDKLEFMFNKLNSLDISIDHERKCLIDASKDIKRFNEHSAQRNEEDRFSKLTTISAASNQASTASTSENVSKSYSEVPRDIGNESLDGDPCGDSHGGSATYSAERNERVSNATADHHHINTVSSSSTASIQVTLRGHSATTDHQLEIGATSSAAGVDSISESIASPSTISVEPFKLASNINGPQLIDDMKIVVSIRSIISPHEFYVQTSGDPDNAINELSETLGLESYYLNEVPGEIRLSSYPELLFDTLEEVTPEGSHSRQIRLKSSAIGTMLVALFHNGPEFRFLRRCSLRNYHTLTNEVELLLLDVGEVVARPVEDCFLMHEKFAKIPKLSVKCSLFDLLPVGESGIWSDDCTAQLGRLLTETEQQYVACVKNGSSQPVQLELLTTTLINVNQQLINLGLAISKTGAYSSKAIDSYVHIKERESETASSEHDIRVRQFLLSGGDGGIPRGSIPSDPDVSQPELIPRGRGRGKYKRGGRTESPAVGRVSEPEPLTANIPVEAVACPPTVVNESAPRSNSEPYGASATRVTPPLQPNDVMISRILQVPQLDPPIQNGQVPRSLVVRIVPGTYDSQSLRCAVMLPFGIEANIDVSNDEPWLENQIKEMLWKIHVHYSSSDVKSLKRAAIGQNVILRLPMELDVNGCEFVYRRAVVLSTQVSIADDSPFSVKLFSMDSGDIHMVTLNDIFPITAEFVTVPRFVYQLQLVAGTRNFEELSQSCDYELKVVNIVGNIKIAHRNWCAICG